MSHQSTISTSPPKIRFQTENHRKYESFFFKHSRQDEKQCFKPLNPPPFALNHKVPSTCSASTDHVDHISTQIHSRTTSTSEPRTLVPMPYIITPVFRPAPQCFEPKDTTKQETLDAAALLTSIKSLISKELDTDAQKAKMSSRPSSENLPKIPDLELLFDQKRKASTTAPRPKADAIAPRTRTVLTTPRAPTTIPVKKRQTGFLTSSLGSSRVRAVSMDSHQINSATAISSLLSPPTISHTLDLDSYASGNGDRELTTVEEFNRTLSKNSFRNSKNSGPVRISPPSSPKLRPISSLLEQPRKKMSGSSPRSTDRRKRFLDQISASVETTGSDDADDDLDIDTDVSSTSSASDALNDMDVLHAPTPAKKQCKARPARSPSKGSKKILGISSKASSSSSSTKTLKTILRKKFSWKNFPELEKFLIANREEYLRHSALNYTMQQKQYNNRLTERLIDLAAECGYAFDEAAFTFVTIRDRIRCYFKSYVQSRKKRGVIIGYAARKAGLLSSEELEKSAGTKGKIVLSSKRRK